MNQTLIENLDPQRIGSINVSKNNALVNGDLYHEAIQVTMNDHYQSRIIPLNQIKEKYIKETNDATLYKVCMW